MTWFLFFCLTAPGQYMAMLQKLLKEPKLQGASWGLAVVRCSDGQTLLAHNPDLRLIPASVQKLLISYAALEILGPDHRFASHLYVNQVFQIGSFMEFTLVAASRSNPAFGSERLAATSDADGLDSLLRWLRSRGVSRLAMHVVTLTDNPARYRLPQDWYVEDLAYAYGAWPTPFVFRENLSELRVTHEHHRQRLYYNGSLDLPEHLRVEIRSDAKVRRGGRLASQLSSLGGRWVWYYTVTLRPGDSAVFRIPEILPERVFLEKLKEKVMSEFSDDAVFIHSYEIDPQSLKEPFYTVESLRLAALDSVVNYESNNFLAEMLLWNLFNDKLSYSDKVKELEAWWERNTGLDAALDDACGLSRSNLMSPRFITECLRYIFNRPLFYTFYNTLPQWGVTGTLQHLARPHEASYACVRAKSGSMSGVQCYAGFVPSSSEGMLCFALMFNHFTCSAGDIQQLCNEFIKSLCSNK